MSFGQSASLFNQVRRDYYTSELIEIVAGILAAMSGQRLIDVGCGTGISTRQLAACGFDVAGTDLDVDMIEEASSLGKAAGYFVMSADRLQFPDESFHGATAFSAFHWFCDDSSVREIRRVLQTGSRFVVVKKSDCGPFRERIVEIVRRYVTLTLDKHTAGYYPVEVLKKGGFHDIQERTLTSIERLPVETAVSFVRTMRFWEEVPQLFHASIDEALRGYVTSQLNEAGYFLRPITTTIIYGRK